jgi:Xaa-Pro aminopeptidase
MDDNQLLNEKLEQATSILNEYNLDAWLTFARETVLMPDPALELILGLHVTWHSAFLISRTGQHIAIIGHFDAENVRNLGVYSQVIGYHQGIGEHLLAALDKLAPDSIAINYSQSDFAADGLTLGNYHTLLGYLQNTPYVDRLLSAERIIGSLRGRKTKTEIDRVKAAVETTEKLFNEVEEFVQLGMTQRQIADFVHGRIEAMELGYAWEEQYNPIVTCGPNSPYGHVEPGDVPLEKGHTLHLDLGVQQDGYCSDMQRMWYILDDGETAAPDDVQHAFDAVYGAIKAAEAVLKPGVPGWKVDAASRKYVTEAGYPEYMHAVGHLLGRSAHDGATVLAPRWERYAGIADLPVEVGNIFTLELHVPVPNRGLMSLEEDVLVTENGVEYLSTPQTELRYLHF